MKDLEYFGIVVGHTVPLSQVLVVIVDSQPRSEGLAYPAKYFAWTTKHFLFRVIYCCTEHNPDAIQRLGDPILTCSCSVVL